MARSGNQKQKILYLVQMLSEHREESNLLSMREIVEELEKKGIRAERKSIYDDMEALREFGIPIKYRRKRPGGYYICGEMPIQLEQQAAVKKEETKQQEEPEENGPEIVREENWKDTGEEREVKISCPVELYGRISAYLHGPLERKDKKDGTAVVTGYAVIGNGFYGWLTSLGTEVQLLRPKKVAAAYRDYLRTIAKKYKEK